jgi:hypothetical protein
MRDLDSIVLVPFNKVSSVAWKTLKKAFKTSRNCEKSLSSWSPPSKNESRRSEQRRRQIASLCEVLQFILAEIRII